MTIVPTQIFARALAPVLLLAMTACGGTVNSVVPSPALGAGGGSVSTTLASGVTFTHVERTSSAPVSYAVDAGFRTDMPAAQSLAASYAGTGYAPTVVAIAQRPTDLPGTGAFGYLVRIAEFDSVDAATAIAAKLKSAGLSASVAATNLEGFAQADGPLVVNVLTIDPTRYRGAVVPKLAAGIAKGLVRTSTVAAREGAFAAVNGGYFVIGDTDGTPGDTAGISVIDGKLVTEAVNGRTSLIVGANGRAEIDALTTTEIARSDDGAERVVTGLNRKLGVKRSCGGGSGETTTPLPRHDFNCFRSDELVVFTSKFGTVTDPGAGLEAVLDKANRVTAIDETRGNAIPPDGQVIAAIGASVDWLRTHARVGSQLVTSSVVIGEGGRVRSLDGVGVINGGPRLVRGGRVEIDGTAEGFEYATPGGSDFYYGFGIRRNPRTLAGITADGKLLLVTADGRQPTYSIGLSFDESAALMLSLGAVDAVNLDGGGSSTFVANGRLVNRPSDTTGERPVGNTIVLLDAQ